MSERTEASRAFNLDVDPPPEKVDGTESPVMSRFLNLEFDSGNTRELSASAGETVRDEAFFMADSQRAFEEGDFERGLRSFAKVLEFNPKNVAAWSGQVRMLIELSEPAEAKLWADKALERFPRDPELLASKAVALARTGDLKAAMAFSDAAFEERGETPYIWIARGDVLLARKEPRADYCFDKAVSLSPASWFVRWLISRVHAHYQRFASSLKSATEGLSADASQPALWMQLGLCQQELGLIGAAAGSFERALQLNPRLIGARAAVRRVNHLGLLDRIVSWVRRPFSR